MEENTTVKKKKNNQNIGQTLVIILCGGIGGLFGYYGGDYLETLGVSRLESVLIFIGALLICYVQIIMHEVGHLIFGLISGYKFVSFRIGSVILYKRQGKLHLGKYSIAGTGGQCLMLPPEMEDGKIPYKLYNLGGSLMNLILVAISVVLFFVANPNVVVGALYVVNAVLGLLFAVMNGIPMRLGGLDNDGYNVLSLGKKPEAMRAFWLQLKVNEMLTEGVRPKNMPDEWFEKPSEEDMRNSMIATIAAMRCNCLLDKMDFAQASQEIEDIVNGDNKMVGVQKMLLQVDAIFCEIFGERREEVLNQMKDKTLKSFMKSMKAYPSVVRTQYAYALLIEQNEKKAAKYRKKFAKIMKRHPSQCETESEWEFIKCCEELVSNEHKIDISL